MSKRKKISLIFSSIVAGAFVCSQAGSVAFGAALKDDSDILRKAISAYNAGHYTDAVGYIEMYLPEHEEDATAHYYLANAYRNLGYKDKAKQQYLFVYRCHPDRQLREYAKQGLASYRLEAEAQRFNTPSKVTPIRSSTFASRSSTIYTNSFAPRTSSSQHTSAPLVLRNYDSSGSLTAMSPSLVRSMRIGLDNGDIDAEGNVMPDPNDAALSKALSHMEQQAQDSARNYQIQNSLNGLGSYYDTQIAKAIAQRDERINYLQANPTYDSKGRVNARTAEIEAEKNRTEQLIKSYKLQQSNEARTGHIRQNDEVEKYQELVKQYEQDIIQARQHPGKDSPNLQLLGTDLYTRNYGNRSSGELKPPAEPDELLAQQERLVLDAHSRPGHTVSHVIKDPMPEHRVDPNTDLKVHGQVMP